MELDELKILIRDDHQMASRQKTPGEIAALLVKNANSVTAKLKRSIWFEIIACVVLALGLAAAGLYTTYTSFQIYFSFFAVICVLFIPVLYYLLKKTRQLGATAMPVKSNLQQLSTILRQYVTMYFRLTMAIIPVSFMLAFTLGYNDDALHMPGKNPYAVSLHETPSVIMFLTAYFIVFAAGMYYFTKWYLKKLYGNYLDQLQQLVRELEGEA